MDIDDDEELEVNAFQERVTEEQPANEVRSFAYDNAQKYASQEEVVLCSVLFVNYARAHSGSYDILDLIIDESQGYEDNQKWDPPTSWKGPGTVLTQMKSLLKDASSRKAGYLVPVERALAVGFAMTTTASIIAKYIGKLVLNKNDKNALMIPGNKSRVTHMLPAVARYIQFNKDTINKILEESEEECTAYEVSHPSPDKSVVKALYHAASEDCNNLLDENDALEEEIAALKDEMAAKETELDRLEAKRDNKSKQNRKRAKRTAADRRSSLIDGKAAAEARALDAELTINRLKTSHQKNEADWKEERQRLLARVTVLEQRLAAEENEKCALEDKMEESEHKDDGSYKNPAPKPNGGLHGFEVRLRIITLLAIGVPASIVVSTLLASAFKFPGNVPRINFVRNMRSELRIVVCALAATACAQPCARWMQITHDGTSVNGKELVTFGVRMVKLTETEEKLGDPFFVSLGSFYCDGRSAKQEKDAIVEKCLTRYGDYLKRWLAEFQRMFPEEPHPNIHPASGLNLSRVAGGSVMQDACNQAQKLGTLLQEEVASEVKKALGDEWNTMPPEQRTHQTRCLRLFCQNHLRNTCLRWAIKAELKLLRELLGEVVKSIPPDIRVSLNMDAAIRAACKEFLFSKSQLYAKGHGMSFLAWAIVKHPMAVVYVLERADLGTRQDHSTEGALALLMNRL
jgi:hypothetical protein